MKLLIQPEHGAGSLIKEIDGAKKTIEIAIFRFDHVDIERALERAVDRGVSVHALIANTNHGEEKSLRKLEMDLLPAGVEVSRTADDLLRHHYKFMIVDRRVLYVLTFNYTHLDVEQSRSFGLVIDDPEAVEEAARLFYADVRRQPYKPGLNKRRELGLIVRDRDIVHSLVKVFESDWAGLVPARQSSRKETAEGAKIVRKAVKAIVRELPLAPIVQEALEHAVGEVPNFELRVNELRHNLTDAVKEAVEDAVCGIVRKGTA